MASIDILIEQVRAILIQTEDTKPKHEIYNQFINECKANSLTEQDFYMKVLKVAHKSIDWNYIEEQKKKKENERIEKEEKEKAIEIELEEVKKQIKYAPKFIDRLIKSSFDDEVVEKEELISIFDKAERLSQDTYALAERISNLFDEKNFKAYPKANYDLPSLRQTICSTNWHSNERYLKLTTPPPPPFPWKKLMVATTLLLIAGGALFYIFWLKPYLEDKNAKRYYTYVDNLIMRSSQIAGVDHNFLQKLKYGAELLVYSKDPENSEWAYVKSNEQKGYVSTEFILNKRDFYELNGIFGDVESKEAISTAKCRKALLHYFQDTIARNIMGKIDPQIQLEIYGTQKNKDIWQVFSKGKDIKPNTVAFPRFSNPNSKFSDFACIIKNIVTNKRKLLLFAFSETGDPSLVYETDAPDEGYIKTIKRSYKYGDSQPLIEYVN